MIPDFRDDGYLPEGLYPATQEEVINRFGKSSPRRRRLVQRLRRWIAPARQTGANRLLIDGSFVTAKEWPNDIDAVVLLAGNFDQQIKQGSDAAMELEEMLLTRCPEELFAAEDIGDWTDWIEFFSRTRESDGRRKGLIEVQL